MAYTYTAGGKLASKIGRQITSSYGDWVEVFYSYNTAGDLISVRNSLWLTPGITNTYNRLGLLEGIVQGTNTTTRSYDNAGQLLSETYTGGTLNGFSVNYSYDSLMRLSQLRVPGVLTNTYSYDTAGRVTSLSNGTYSANYSYTTNSPLVSQILFKQGSATRLTTSMGYDQLNRMTNIVSTPSGSTNIFGYTSLYNAVSQRTKTTLADNSYWDYVYDDLGQLDSGGKHTSAGAQISGRQFAYEQDEIGNRISVNGSTSYTANNVNQYTAINSQNLTYDGDGNMLSDGNWTYTWDGENRLTRMVSTNQTKTLAFTYDYQGRRIEKKVWNNTTGSGTPATYLKYIYDGWNLIAELNGKSSDAVVRIYSWGPETQGAPGTLRMIADNNGVYFPAYDPNGNVMGLVKASDGTVCAQYEYLPYGELVTATGTMAGSNSIRFSTKYYDTEARLYYYGYRYYSPDMGRWLSRDPFEEQGGLNLYAFVNNDPVNYCDLWGMKNRMFFIIIPYVASFESFYFPYKGEVNLSFLHTTWYEIRFPKMVQYAFNRFSDEIKEKLNKKCKNNESLDIKDNEIRHIWIGAYGTGESETLGQFDEGDVGDKRQFSYEAALVLGNYKIEIHDFNIRYEKRMTKKLGCCFQYEWNAKILVKDGLGLDPSNIVAP